MSEDDDPEYRERIDGIFLDAKKSKSVFSDVDRHDINIDDLKELSYNQLKITYNLIQMRIEESIEQKTDPKQTKIPSYIN